MRDRVVGPESKYQNTRKPTDTDEGIELLGEMNAGHHAELSEWGMPHLDFAIDDWCLDLGCGGGANVARMLSYCPDGHVCGIDYSPASVEYASRFNGDAIASGRCEIREGDVADLPYGDCTFDKVTAYETIYFWPDMDSAFSEAYRVCKHGGAFLVCNESDGTNESVTDDWVGIIEMNIYTAEQVRDLMTKAGFVDVEIDGKPERSWMSIVGHRA